MEDSQFPDAPETPAPVFAYRALKGFFFGSPADDDDHHRSKHHERQSDENKENISPVKRHPSSPKPHSTTQGNRKRGLANDAISSPMKSILRPSGVATPRALQLQRGNVGVTFKEVRQTVSPEGKENVPSGGPDPEVVVKRVKPDSVSGTQNNNVNGIHVVETSQKSGIVASTKIATGDFSGISNPTATAPSVDVLPFDIEAYKRTTEKEMKKLVRYGQKMREYARKQDEENAKLRRLLEECRGENERLRRAEERRVRPQESDKGGKEAAQQQQSGIPHRSAAGEAVKGGATGLAVQRQFVEETKEKRGNEGDEGQRRGKRLKLNTDGSSKTVEHRKETSAAAEDGQEDFKGHSHGTRHSSARLPPDRLAAARERIRARAEKRKASEMSEMDWAGL